jgi:hypothetical protein
MAVRERLCPIERRRAALRSVALAERAPEEPPVHPEVPAAPVRPVSSEVVAEVLVDGTIRQVGEPARAPRGEYETGQISGDGWILWWERRRLE